MVMTATTRTRTTTTTKTTTTTTNCYTIPYPVVARGGGSGYQIEHNGRDDCEDEEEKWGVMDGTIYRDDAADSSNMDTDRTNLGRNVRVLGGVLGAGP